MTSRIYDTFRNLTIESFDDDGLSAPALKAVTVRPLRHTVALAEHLAQQLEMSRSALLDRIVSEGVYEACDAYFEAHGSKADEVKKAFLDEFSISWSKQVEELNK